jgi:hypothetical protein
MLCFENAGAAARTVQLNGALVRALLPDETFLAALVRRLSTAIDTHTAAEPPRGVFGCGQCPVAVCSQWCHAVSYQSMAVLRAFREPVRGLRVGVRTGLTGGPVIAIVQLHTQ